MAFTGRSDRPGPPASASYADVGRWILRGVPLGVELQGKEATRIARRDATLYRIASIHHLLFKKPVDIPHSVH